MPDNLMEKILNDKDFSRYASADIRRLVDEEMAKSPDQRDYQKIAKLSSAYCEIVGAEDMISQTSQTGIDKVIQKSKAIKRKPSRRITLTISLAISIAVLAIANVVTVSAWDMDVFEAIIHFTKDGFSVDFPEKDAIVLPKSEDDPYGIKTECAKYGMEVEAPTYLPEGFVLQDVGNNVISDYVNLLEFHFYRNAKEAIVINYSLYEDQKGSGIPSDNFNLSEISVNGKPAVVSKEDNQFTIIFQEENLQTVIYTYSLDYNECEKIIASLK